MELFIILAVVAIHQWLVIPMIKKKIRYMRPEEPTIFYAYKTKWQLPVELMLIVVAVLAVIVLTPALGIWSVLFIPIAMSAILALRGMLEKRYEAHMKHYIISYIQASALLCAFVFIVLYAFIVEGV